MMYIIRECQPADLREIVQLTEHWASEDITHGLVPTVIAHLETRLGRYFWVAECSAQIVGYAYGSVHVSEGLAVIPTGERYLEIEEVYIHPDHRQQGLGSEVLDRLLSLAESEGIIQSLVYSATKDWQRIVGFYERHGFRMWYVQMHRDSAASQ